MARDVAQLREKDIGRLKGRTPFDGNLISYLETMVRASHTHTTQHHSTLTHSSPLVSPAHTIPD